MSVAAENQLAPVLNIPAGAAVTSEAVAAAVATATVYDINFDFSSIDEKTALLYLQQNKYQLMAYKGASGPGQVSAGLPTWFTMPFTNVMGKLDISYTPTYLVYYFDSESVSATTVITMTGQSLPTTLGTALELDGQGNFTVSSTPAPAGTIQLTNNRAAGTSNLTVGLAASINGNFSPFCAFTVTPGGSLQMTPHENASFFASQSNIVSGSVTANAAAPGVVFQFDGGTQLYKLAIATDGTYAVISAGAATTPLASGDALNMLN